MRRAATAWPTGSGARRQRRIWWFADTACARQGRDFDTLARELVARADGPIRVVCPDVVGRGRSDWLKDPMGYQIPTYVGDMLALLAELHQQAPIGTWTGWAPAWAG
jgi:pimeloyl-ACP methyl ester carboxylesterase